MKYEVTKNKQDYYENFRGFPFDSILYLKIFKY